MNQQQQEEMIYLRLEMRSCGSLKLKKMLPK